MDEQVKEAKILAKIIKVKKETRSRLNVLVLIKEMTSVFEDGEVDEVKLNNFEHLCTLVIDENEATLNLQSQDIVSFHIVYGENDTQIDVKVLNSRS